uniref:Uncharacterized protein n=1 Tax=candidate division CPR3 bacterium TaxID=2268181 RepID=A0A7V3N4I6_UNCC3
MTKKQILLVSVLSVVLIFVLSLSIVLFKKPQKQEKEVYFATPTITKTYCFHKKSFPAPYAEVNGLPMDP